MEGRNGKLWSFINLAALRVKRPLSGRAQRLPQFSAEKLRAEQTGMFGPERERFNMESVFSAARGAQFQSFSICILFSNDSLRVITVLFTNEVWKIRESAEAVNSPAGMRGLSPGDRKHRSSFLWDLEREREAGVDSPSPPKGRLAGDRRF